MDMSDEVMLMKYEIRFWKQKAWRAEQQREHEVQLRKEAEAKLDRFKGVPQEALEEILIAMKMKKLAAIKEEAGKLMGIVAWINKNKEEESIENLDTRLQFWSSLIRLYTNNEHGEDE